MFRKFISILMIIGLMISGLGACSKKTVVYGNTSGNINNSGLFVQQGEWVYYSNIMSNYHLMKRKTDGSQETELTDEVAISINIIDDWIYYMSSTEFEIHKMKTDGSSKTRLGTAHASYFGNIIVRDDTIYFANADANYTLHSMKTDGSELKKLGDQQTFKFYVDDDWIYYMKFTTNTQTYESTYELRKMKTNGQDDALLDDKGGYHLIVDQGWIYYSSSANNEHLYRMKTNGKDKKEILNWSITNLNLANGKLYFTTQQENKLKMSALDGSSVSNLTDDQASGINITGDWLFYRSMKYFGRLYKIKLDGTELQKAYSIELVSPNPAGAEIVRGLGRPNRSEQSAMVARDGDWLFNTFHADSFAIYKNKLDGTEDSKVTSSSASFLNLLGDWLYFIDMNSGYSIARVKKDGTQYGVILDLPCNELIVRDEWMYFTDMSQDRKIYKIKIDGTDLTKVSDDSGFMIQLIDDHIMYTLFPTDYSPIYKGIRRINIDGTNKVVLINESINAYAVDENYIYYTEFREDGVMSIRKTNMAGTINVTLVSDYASLFGVKDGWIYYNDGLDEGGLKRISSDGMKKQVIMAPGNFANFHFIDDKIIVYENNTETYYIMNPDGSNRSVWKAE